MSRARFVVVTGAPGSGKTTLGRLLSAELRLPFLARDDVRGGLFCTAGAWTPHPGPVPASADASDVFLRVLETVAALGVSYVVEYVVPAHRPADRDRLVAAADCVAVVTECRDPLARVARRNRADRLLNRAPVLAALGHATIDEHTAAAVERMGRVAATMLTDLGVPTLRVATDDGYAPGLDAIAAFATAGTR